MRHIVRLCFRTWIGSGDKIDILPVDCFQDRVVLEAFGHESGQNAIVLEYKSDNPKDIAEVIQWYAYEHKHDTFEMSYRMNVETEVKI